MNRQLDLALMLLVLAFCVTPIARAAPPKTPVVPGKLSADIETLHPGVKLTLLAEHPALVTPIGIDVDPQGNIYVVSSHTHFRPLEYAGPEHDEILVFDRDGTNRRVFYNKTDKTMHVKVGLDGWIYLAERSRLLRVKDTNGDGVGDVEETIATLNTLADYPHNGLSGMAWHPDGGLVFSLGENFSNEWTLESRQGFKLTGRGEGGVFRCRLDGAELRRIARGFWNPFGLLVRKDGEIFAVDNDPGSRPPCRLLHVIDGADYGFQRAYGGGAVHPFVGWNGELRGTLPMIHPSGEAPCALVPLGGGVIVPSWSTHCVDYFPLERQGAGYTSRRIEILRGSEYFRPTGIAEGPDGTFFMTDWVFSSYELHGRGRLWKLEIDHSQAAWIKKSEDPINDAARLADGLRQGTKKLSTQRLFEHARGSDAYLADAALTALARKSATWTTESLRAMPASQRVWAIVALRRVDMKEEKWVRAFFDDPDPEVQFECLRWIADAVLTRFDADVEKMLTRSDLEYRLFEAVLATWNTLQGLPGAGVTDKTVLMERITDAATPARLKGFSLRLVPATHPKLTVPLLRDLLAANDSVLSLEVVRTLVGRGSREAKDVLAQIAFDRTRDKNLRAEAIVGLSSSTDPEHQTMLLQIAGEENVALRNEALRAMRSMAISDAAKLLIQEIARQHPDSAQLVDAILNPDTILVGRPELNQTAEWLKRLDKAPGEPSVAAGRRLFFHPRLAQCASCHRHTGRGNVVGPDLSLIAKQGTRSSVLQSILQPSREIAPQYFHTNLLLTDGTVFSGILLRSSSVDVFRDGVGKERRFKKEEIEQRSQSKTSLMPVGVVASLTDGELRDLLAFLTSDAATQ